MFTHISKAQQVALMRSKPERKLVKQAAGQWTINACSKIILQSSSALERKAFCFKHNTLCSVVHRKSLQFRGTRGLVLFLLICESHVLTHFTFATSATRDGETPSVDIAEDNGSK